LDQFKACWKDRISPLLTIIIPLGVMSGCSPSPPPVRQTLVPDYANGATLTGKVTFTGPKPVAAVIDMSAVPACERAHAQAPQKSEDAVVNPNGTLKNVFVWVKDGLPPGNWAVPAAPVVLDQSGCMYQPHVLGIMTGQNLDIRNDDPTNHNIHVEPQADPEWNRSQMTGSDSITHTFSHPQVMLPVKCKIHPWMAAYLGILPHPFFAVTEDDGTFTIKGLPPGIYTLDAWQEKYGLREQHLTVGARESKAVDFAYR
jgi:plastocyanin